MKPETGRAFWNELHAFAQAYPDEPTPDDIVAAQNFLDRFAVRLRKASRGCKCADEWDYMVEWVPPPLHEKAAFVSWAIAAHDRVNKLRMKPLFYKRSALHPFLLPRRPVRSAAEGEALESRLAGVITGESAGMRVQVTRRVNQPCGGGCGGRD